MSRKEKNVQANRKNPKKLKNLEKKEITKNWKNSNKSEKFWEKRKISKK